MNNPSQGYDDSDSVLELRATGRLEQYFAPSTWPANNAADLDMSTAPVLLADGQVLIAGKSGIAYLLNGAHLGVSGTNRPAWPRCVEQRRRGRRVRGDHGLSAVSQRNGGDPCDEVTTVLASAVECQHLGQRPATRGGRSGVDRRQERRPLRARRGDGTGRRQVNIGAVANDFTTPSVGDGFMLVASTNQSWHSEGTP